MADVDLLIKLFDTLRESNKDTNQLCHALLQNQNDISNYIKNLPMEEVKQLLKDHAKNSTDEIDSCTETIEQKTDGGLEEVKKVDTKVGRMILVVITQLIWVQHGARLIHQPKLKVILLSVVLF